MTWLAASDRAHLARIEARRCPTCNGPAERVGDWVRCAQGEPGLVFRLRPATELDREADTRWISHAPDWLFVTDDAVLEYARLDPEPVT